MIETTFIYVGEALCDLGAADNLMPYATFKKIGGLELRACFMGVGLADSTLAEPTGMVRYMMINLRCLILKLML